MNWKQFLKPNKKKVIIAIVIVLILFIIEALAYTWFMGNFGGCLGQCGDYYLPWELGSCGHCGYPNLLTSILIEVYWPLVILMTLIISFLFSCLIVWIYDKVKKK